MLIPRNLHELIDTLESLTSLSHRNASLTDVPIDDLLENILGGDFSKALQSFEFLVDPIREKSPQAADDLQKIISGDLPLAKSLPRMLQYLRHVQPNTAEAFRCEVPKTKTNWTIKTETEEL
jgi:hypothetical protein